MESTADSRFDPNYAMELLLDIGHEPSLENLLNKLVTRAIEQPTEIASSQGGHSGKEERWVRRASAAGHRPPGRSSSDKTIAAGKGGPIRVASSGELIVGEQAHV